MYKYFMEQQEKLSFATISQEQLAQYRLALICEMEKMGATSDELALICDAIIRNSIRNRRKPEDVAWAILQ